MSQEERTQLIRELKELIQMNNEYRGYSYGPLFSEEDLKIVKSVLMKKSV